MYWPCSVITCRESTQLATCALDMKPHKINRVIVKLHKGTNITKGNDYHLEEKENSITYTFIFYNAIAF